MGLARKRRWADRGARPAIVPVPVYLVPLVERRRQGDR
jgi:hypothetical protein